MHLLDFDSPDETRTLGQDANRRGAPRRQDGRTLYLRVGPGHAYVIEPGHDAWVIGDERFVALEFESRSAEQYARS